MACNKKWMMQIGEDADCMQFIQIRPWCNSLLSLLVAVPVTRLSKDTTHTYTIAGHPQFKALLDARNNAQANDLVERKPTEAAAEGLARLFAEAAQNEAVGSDEQPSKAARVGHHGERRQHVVSRRGHAHQASTDDIITVYIGDNSFVCVRPRIAREPLFVKCDSKNLTVVLDFLHAEIKTVGDLCFEAYDRTGAYAKRDAAATGDGGDDGAAEGDEAVDDADDKAKNDIDNADIFDADEHDDDLVDAAPAAAPSAWDHVD